MVGMELGHVPDIYDGGDDDDGGMKRRKSLVEREWTTGDEALGLQVLNLATLSYQHLRNLPSHSKTVLKTVQIIATRAFLLRSQGIDLYFLLSILGKSRVCSYFWKRNVTFIDH
jgi:hypothetical protein